jgi:hypothetical protein
MLVHVYLVEVGYNKNRRGEPGGCMGKKTNYTVPGRLLWGQGFQLVLGAFPDKKFPRIEE